MIKGRQVADKLDLGHWGCAVNDDGHLMLDGCDLVELAGTYGTPVHVVSKRRLLENCVQAQTAFRGALGAAEIFYSYKTNCIPALLQVIHDKGIGAEVISPYELWLALKLGLPGSRIIYNGPHKSRESLELAVGSELKLVNVDSLTDLRAVAAVSRGQQKAVNLGLRLCPTKGWNAQFGFGIKNGEALEGLKLIEANKDLLKLKGLHLHLGSQITNRSVFAGALEEVLAFALDAAGPLAAGIEYIDVGGGFGVPTVREVGGLERRLCRLLGQPFRPPRPERCPRLEDLAATIDQTLSRYSDRFPGGRPTVIAEPGRAISSNAQILLLGVCAMKDRRPPAVILDGGKMNITYPTSFEYHHVLAANRMLQAAAYNYKLVGRTCTPSDLVYDNVSLPALSEGDVIAIMDAGAYFTSFSSDFAFPRPPIVLLDAGVATMARERETFEGVVARDRLSWPSTKRSVVA